MAGSHFTDLISMEYQYLGDNGVDVLVYRRAREVEDAGDALLARCQSGPCEKGMLVWMWMWMYLAFFGELPRHCA